MKTRTKNTVYTLLFMLTMVMTTACQDEMMPETGDIVEGEPVTLLLNFGTKGHIDIRPLSRATLDGEQEKKIYNFYLYIFDELGNKVYGHFFDSQNYDDNLKGDNSWKMSNGTGTIRIKTVSKQHCTVYAIANIDTDMVNVSAERLGIIQKEQHVNNMVTTMNQITVARNGYFTMSAKLEDQTISPDTQTAQKSLSFQRIDAKVIFNFYIAEPAKGKPQVKDFVPRSWRVMNVPESSFVFDKEESVKDKKLFDTPAANFEGKSQVTINGTKTTADQFSFYMQENTTTAKATPPSKIERSRYTRNAEGKREWTYAPDGATYVEVKGRVIFDHSPTEQGEIGAGETNAEVTYLIHLGDFTTRLDDYNVLRNTQYTFNVGIRGIEDIRLEVEKGEDKPGASGSITQAKEKIFNCDAHYEAHVMTFYLDDIDPDNMTWYVRTPFSTSQVNSETMAVDYKWVHFQLNEMITGSDGKKLYSTKLEKYNPDAFDAKTKKGSMNITGLVKLLVEERKKFDLHQDDPNLLFDHYIDPTTQTEKRRICVTAHIDEFYYEVNPLTGNKDAGLWKRFVNQPMRIMQIMSTAKVSPDQESMDVKTAYTIQQRSIQTIYNVKDQTLNSAWGCEYWDENADQWNYKPKQDPINAPTNRHNTSPYNGRLNTCKEWGLTTDYTGTTFNAAAPKEWNLFMDWNVEQSNPTLREEVKSLRYACMTRNRDNNNNGIIDEDEVRWYTASIRQLIGIWMGADGISNDARLYRKEGIPTDPNHPDSWRQHILSSTQYNNANNEHDDSNNPILIWGEESTSTGSYTQSLDKKFGNIYSIRCVRNLGTLADGTDITHAPVDSIPDDYLKVENTKINANGTVTTVDPNQPYIINLERMNLKSIRYYTSHELGFSDENSMQNRLYAKFEAQPRDTHQTYNAVKFETANEKLNNSFQANPYCPPGYRLPNQREITLMNLYLPADYWERYNYYLSRTFFSFGHYGNQKEPSKTGWVNSTENLFLSSNTKDSQYQKSTESRCVRDIK